MANKPTYQELEKEIKLLQQQVKQLTSIKSLSKKEKTADQSDDINNRLKATMEALPDMFFELDLAGRFIDFKGSSFHKLASSPEIFLGKLLTDVLPIGIAARFVNALTKVVHKKQRQVVDYMLKIDGQPSYFEAIMVPKLKGEKVESVISLVRDISDRKIMAQTIKESQENLSVTLDSIGDGVITTDNHGFITRMNPIAEKMCGWSLKEAKGKLYDEVFCIINSKTGKKVQSPISRVLKEGIIVGLANHTVLISKTGVKYQISDSAGPIKREDGEIIGVVMVFQDVTEKYQMEEIIRKGELRYRYLFEQSPIGILQFDNGFIITDINKKFASIMGLGRDKILGVNLKDIKDKRVLHCIEQAILGKESFLEGIYAPTFSKNVVYGSIKTSPIYASSDKTEVIGGIAIVEDITDRKLAEKALSDTLQKYSSIFNHTNDGIILLDEKGEVLEWNKGAELITGITRKELQSKHIWDLQYEMLPIEDKSKSVKEKIKRNLKRFFKTGEMQGLYTLHNQIILRKDGLKCNVQQLPFKIKTEKGFMFGSILRDITDQVNINEALVESENKFRTLANITASAIFIIQGTKILYTNQAGRYLIDFKEENTQIVDFWEVVHPDFSEIVKKRGLLRQLGKKIPSNYEFKVINKKRGDRWIDFTATVFEFNGKPAIIATAHDITNLKNTEVELRQAKERFDLAVIGTNDGLIDWDLISNTVYYSDKLKQMLGYLPSDINNSLNEWYDRIHPDDQHKIRKDVQLYLASNNKREKEIKSTHRVKHKKGYYLWLNFRGLAVRNEYGQPSRMVGFLTDISDKIKSEQQQKFLSTVTEQVSDSIVVANLDFKITYVNRATEILFGFKSKELIGYPSSVIFNSDTFPELEQNTVYETLKTGNIWQGEIGCKRKTGEGFICDSKISPMFDENKQVYAYIAIHRDVSEQKQYENKLKESKIKAEESDRLKSAFLANMSHEIRTPMNGMIGFADLLRDPNLSQAKRTEYIEIINRNGGVLLGLIDDIINLSKIESNQFSIREDDCNINELCEEIYAFYSNIKLFNNKNIELIFVKPQEILNPIIVTDPMRLRQILINLIGNAFKFTEKGFIEYGYNITSNKIVQFYVRDSGIGVPLEMQELIFQRFRQLDESPTRKFGGTGLGLAISKGIVELLGGKIWLESIELEGSVFNFTIPYNKSSLKSMFVSKIQVSKKKYDWTTKTILIVEDHEESYLLIEAILIPTNAKIIYAKNGDQAVKLFNSENIDLILMDIHMSGLDGYETLKNIRAIDKEIPVIAQTAFAMLEDKERCLQLGFNDYIKKPIDTKIIISKIERLLK